MLERPFPRRSKGGIGEAAATFFALDFVWLTLATRLLYRPLLADSPKLLVAALFYRVYLVGLAVLAVLPAANAGSWVMGHG